MKNKANSVFSNVTYVIKHSFKQAPLIIIYSLMLAGVSVWLSMLEAYLPSMVVKGIEEEWQKQEIFFRVFLVISGFVIIRLLIYFFSNLFSIKKADCRLGFTLLLHKSIMENEYQSLEQQSVQMRINQVAYLLYPDNDSTGIGAIWVGIRDFLLTILGIATAITILHKLNIGIVLFVLVISLLNTSLTHYLDRYIRDHRDQWGNIDQKIDYINSKMVLKEYAKEVKEYYCEKWIIEKLGKLISERGQWFRKTQNKSDLTKWVKVVMGLCYDVVVLGYVIWNYFQGRILISECVFYIGVISQLAGFMNQGLGAVNLLIKAGYDVDMIREVVDLPMEKDRLTGLVDKIGKEQVEIRFEHVSFRYDPEGEDVISDLNLTIRKGEKLAIVGENGAGKTTLVELMTGMYTPTSGKIYYNDIPIHEYTRAEIYQLISAAFQDCVIYPFTIEDNVILGNSVRSEERVRKCLSDVGLEKYVSRMGEALISEASENAIDLSGGERQKLLIARAIYKDAPILVLDEPTAALDAVAESELYLLYKKYAESKTSLFISHRLASTRFCDRIIFLKKGRIQEEGTHEQLMAAKKEYAELFEVQSKYYKEGQGMPEE